MNEAAARQLGEADAERLIRLIVSQLDGLRVADALEVVHGAARALLRGDGVARDAVLGARTRRQFGEHLTTEEAAEFLAARLGPFAPTLATIRSWARPSRRRAYPHLDMPAPHRRSRPHVWKRQDLEDWIDRRLTGKAPAAVVPALNAAGLNGFERWEKTTMKAIEKAADLVDRAIQAGDVAANARDFLIGSVKNHPGGPEAGLAALERGCLGPARIAAEERERAATAGGQGD